MSELDAQIARALSGENFALYGAGQLGRMTLDMWPQNRMKPLFFIDAVKTGDYCGLPVHPLDGPRPENVTYLLSAFKIPAVTAKEIFHQLGQPLMLTAYDFFDHVMPEEFGNGWRNLAPGAEVLTRASLARAVYADDLSRLAHDSACAWRYRREMPDNYPVAPEEDKYNLAFLGRQATHYDLVIDAGSYDLHTLDMLHAGGVSWDSVAAFEADPARADICRSRAGEGGYVHEIAVADFDGEADFLATGLLSARLAGPGVKGDPRLKTVPVARLDSFSRQFGPLAGKRILLKLHIEGAELPALKGAEELLRTAHCDVLLNLSHDEQSLLDLPVYLRNLGRFDIFLRSHSLFGEGLTLFARCRDF